MINIAAAERNVSSAGTLRALRDGCCNAGELLGLMALRAGALIVSTLYDGVLSC